MTISYDNAINQLRTNPTAYGTKESLLALVRDVSIDASTGLTQGKVTVLYSGMATSSIHTTDIVSAMMANEGTDLVFSSISTTLGNNLETLVLTGTAAINATGNALGNVLVGNSGANVLAGGAGNDSYVLNRGDGADTISESDATAGNTDVALFGAGITTDQLWFTKTGNNLDVAIIGTNDKFSVSNWYLGSQYHVEQFKTSDGKTLLDSQVQNLVQAMAAFAPPAAGQTTLAANYATALNPVLAANWQ